MGEGKLNIRILNVTEFGREDIVKIFADNGSPVPNPLTTFIQIAETKEGKIAGLAVLQPQYHAEPIFVAPEFRKSRLHEKLITALFKPFEHIKGMRIFVFSPNQKIFNLASRFGFKDLNYKVMVKEF